jgi:hypothetical protein
MGRWAFFHHDKGTYEYKFWFGVQDSEIPWAENFDTYDVEEYDEGTAENWGLTEEQKEIWKEWSGTSILTFEGETEFLKNFVITTHNADGGDYNLESHWEETRALATKLGMPQYSRDEGEKMEDALDRYVNLIVKESTGKENEAEYAELDIKTVICCILQEYGSYQCTYES